MTPTVRRNRMYAAYFLATWCLAWTLLLVSAR